MSRQKQFAIRHSIHNRIRFVIPAVRWNEPLSRQIHSAFESVAGITWVRINPKSASLVIRFREEILSRASLVSILESIFPITKQKQPADRTSPAASVSFMGLTIYAAGILFRRHALKLAVAQNFFSPTGMVVTLFALPLLRKGIKSIREKRVSLESFLGGSIIAASMSGEALAALEILWVTSASEMLSSWVNERSRRAIRDILEVTAKKTYILADNVELEIAIEDVKSGDIVVLHTGEKVAVDGKIIEGKALLDEAVINGRPEPILRKPSDRVFAGTFVRQGVVYVRAEKVGDDTYLARIIEMVEASLENKAPVQGSADRLASNLIKLGFVMTAGTGLLTGSLQRAFTVMLVMSCPCATILAASTAISAALSAAARSNILIKGGRYLEEVGKAETIYFDKTGTLTENLPRIEQIHTYAGIKKDRLLQLAYSAEVHNSHPIALAIKSEAKQRGLEPITHHVCDFILGKGVRSEIENHEVLIGSYKLLEHFSIPMDKTAKHIRQRIHKYEKAGSTVIYIVQDQELLGMMAFSYQRRESAPAVIEMLRADGVAEFGMVTGDEAESARRLCDDLGLSPCHPSVMPEEKAEIIRALKKTESRGVIMVGDGINDALALAEADIGIVMGAGGSDVALEAADIALVRDDLNGIPFVRHLSHETMKIIQQNFWIATGSNLGGVALGAAGYLSPVMAGLLHIVHTVGVLANSSRLLLENLDDFERHLS